MTYLDRVAGPSYFVRNAGFQVESFHGVATATWVIDTSGQLTAMGWFRFPAVSGQPWPMHEALEDRGFFGVNREWGTDFCPIWYPALVFALAGVAALRLGRRFTIRSAIIATTVVAGLLGMAVIL